MAFWIFKENSYFQIGVNETFLSQKQKCRYFLKSVYKIFPKFLVMMDTQIEVKVFFSYNKGNFDNEKRTPLWSILVCKIETFQLCLKNVHWFVFF